MARSSCSPAGTTSCTSPRRYACSLRELVAGQQDAHGIAPAQLLHQAHGRAADRVDAALDLDLREARVVGGHADVGGEQQLDADGQAPAVHCDDQRFAERLLAHQRVERTRRQRRHAAVAEKRQPLRQLDAAGEVLAVREQDGAAQLRVLLIAAERLAQLGVHLQSKALRLAVRFSPISRTCPRVSTVMRSGVTGLSVRPAEEHRRQAWAPRVKATQSAHVGSLLVPSRESRCH